MKAAASNLTKVSLELGGKSPIVVFPSTDIVEAVEWIMFGVFAVNGQICSSTSRAIVHESIAKQLVDRLVEETKKVFVGGINWYFFNVLIIMVLLSFCILFYLDPFSDKDPSMGPLVSKGQQEKVLNYIQIGLKEGNSFLLILFLIYFNFNCFFFCSLFLKEQLWLLEERNHMDLQVIMLNQQCLQMYVKI
jgi:hypothetical protein